MPRQLRSRRPPPNYASLHTGEVGVYVPDPEEQESGSEFAANDSDGNGARTRPMMLPNLTSTQALRTNEVVKGALHLELPLR